MHLHIAVSGDTALAHDLRLIEERAQDFRPVFELLADDFLDIEERQFASEGAHGERWVHLAPSTVAARGGAAHPILVETGELRASLTSEGARGSVRSVGRHELFVGTDVPYARYHQTGTRHMPRRRAVEFTRADRDRWTAELERHLLSGRAGR